MSFDGGSSSDIKVFNNYASKIHSVENDASCLFNLLKLLMFWNDYITFYNNMVQKWNLGDCERQ